MSIVFLAAKTNSTGLLEIKSVKINGREEKMSYGIIPIELVNRVTKLKSDTASFSGRLEYYKDSIGIIKNNFFTGAGGYAWRNSGHETASQGIAEHSYPLQLFIQNGIISFIAYIIRSSGTSKPICFSSPIRRANSIIYTKYQFI